MKPSPRRNAVLLNILSALIESLKGTSVSYATSRVVVGNDFVFFLARAGVMESKGQLGKDKIVAATKDLILSSITSSDQTARCAAAEALGKLCAVCLRRIVDTHQILNFGLLL